MSADVRGRGVRVDDYEGLRAGEAVVAVRRLGLRPALERVEGYQSGLHGFVVSQEPEQGVEVQPGGAVSLFIAAPSRAILGTTQAAGNGKPEVDVESLHVGEPLYSDDTVEIHEVAIPGGSYSESVPTIDEGELPNDEQERHRASSGSPVDRTGDAEIDNGALTDEQEEDASDGDDDDDGDYEPSPETVWRGQPSSAPRSRLKFQHIRGSESARRRRVWSPAVVGWSVLAAFSCVLAALVLVYAVSYRSSSRHPSPRPSVPAHIVVSPSRSPAHIPVAARAADRPHATRPLDQGVTHRDSRRPRRAPNTVSEDGTSLHTGSPTGVVVPTSSVPVEPSGVSAEEHAAMEFGP